MKQHVSGALYRQIEDRFGVARAIPSARAALGLMAALRYWVSQGGGRLVALPANCCQDVIAAILGAGCKPVFCDIDLISGNVPETEWKRARTTGASVALVIHIYGNPAEISTVRRHFPPPECLLIDDAAQALGACNSDGLVGGQGDIGLLSFGATKHISTGGAALLFKDAALAAAVAEELLSFPSIDAERRNRLYAEFRSRYETARTALRSNGNEAAACFYDLMQDYLPVLQAAFPVGAEMATQVALEHYAKAIDLRVRKSTVWAKSLQACGLIPVGMGPGSVPWRFACRLPGIDWRSQHELGERMRSRGVDVSHWYLPGHWLCGFGQGTLPQTETLAQEVFQFWVDDRTSFEKVEQGAEVVRGLVSSYRRH